MRLVMGALALVMLAGCAAPAMNEARSKKPYKTLASSKEAQVVAQCVQFAWQDEAVFGVDASGFLEPGQAGGYTVYTVAAKYFVDVHGEAGATRVNYYAGTDDWPAKRRLAALATCL
ncbi:hypothetical protein [Pseudomonas sp. Irchel 3E20]|uniref:hypothetical protein n=1 Tax=Pseudomonas sp. Irchel 3E20 TaxID=2008983 RepID=UPI000BA3017C|nr:hypothetical protein [Pseudomonas sp. Irchel 3E20]